MSNGYGVDFYGVATYGYSQPADYSVEPFVATQSDYNRITLQWATPNVKPWKSLVLVRNLYGYPSVPADGTTILTITPTAPLTSYDDTGLIAGRYYYYTMFLNLEAPAWSAATTYSISQIISYNGLYWISTQNSNTNHIPSAGSSYWSNTQYSTTWYPAGYAVSLAVGNQGYADRLYTRVPKPYKISNSDVFNSSTIDNSALLHYLTVFGFHFDMLKTEYDNILQMNNPEYISATSLDILGQQLGVRTDYLSSPQLRRQRVKNITANYRLKGTVQGLHNAIASITGWDSVITDSRNMLATGDNSAFAHPQYDNWDATTTYFPNQFIQFSNIIYKCLVQAYGNAQKPTGTTSSNTWWQPQIEFLDTTTLLTPAASGSTNGNVYGGWGYSFNLNYEPTTQIMGVYNGMVHPTDPTILNWHGIGYKYPGSSFNLNPIAVTNLQQDDSSAWTNGTNYLVNDFVTYSGNTYKAVRNSGPGTPYGAITPGTNETYWVPSLLGNNYNPYLVPLPLPALWNPSTAYNVGDKVIYFGLVYQAVVANTNSQPSGNYYPNSNWIYLSSPDTAYTASAYFTRITSSTTAATASINVGFVNPSSVTIQTSTPAYLNRFVGDFSNLNNVNDNSLTSLGSQYAWASSPTTTNYWRSSYGMAYVDQTSAGTTPYITLTFDYGISPSGYIFVTFASDYVDTTHKAHGAVFRYQNNSNFWYATRQSLYSVVGGVETLQASWTRLKDGDRLVLRLTNTSDIVVYKYDRLGTGGYTGLATVTNTSLNTFTKVGLVHKYSASGAV